jgi:hypothetical protein
MPMGVPLSSYERHTHTPHPAWPLSDLQNVHRARSECVWTLGSQMLWAPPGPVFGLLNFHFMYFSDWVSRQPRSHLRESMNTVLCESSHSELQAWGCSSVVLALWTPRLKGKRRMEVWTWDFVWSLFLWHWYVAQTDLEFKISLLPLSQSARTTGVPPCLMS